MGERTSTPVLDRPRITPMSLDGLQQRLGTQVLQDADIYSSTLVRAQQVLNQQPGVVRLTHGIPVYALQDVHANSGMIVRFLERKVPDGDGSITLFDALRQNKAHAVLLGDVAHSQSSDHWVSGRKGKFQATNDELIATMNTQQLAFDLVTEFPGQFLWVRGNHDAQRRIPFGVNNEKNLAIAEAMKREKGSVLYEDWTKTEDLLPYIASNGLVYLSHAAPANGLLVAEIQTKQEIVFEKLAGTENRNGGNGGMSEKEMKKNMEKISDELPFDRDQNWIWIIGHKPTDDEKQGFRLQCDDRLLQIDQRSGEIYAVVKPDGTVYVGDCRSVDSPKVIKRKAIQVQKEKSKEKGKAGKKKGKK